MKLNELDLSKLYPQALANDVDAMAIAYAQEQFYKRMFEKLYLVEKHSQYDNMTDDELDAIAEDVYIPWYKKDDTREVKITNLETFYKIWIELGTVDGLKKVLTNLYGKDALLEEWFDNKEYEVGEFGIALQSQDAMSAEKLKELNRILDIVKRYSQHLTSVFTRTKIDHKQYIATFAHNGHNTVGNKAMGYIPDESFYCTNVVKVYTSNDTIDYACSIS